METRTWADEHVSPMAALAVAVVAVSTSAILVRWSEAPSIVKALYRVLFTTLLLAPFALTRHRGEFGRLAGRDLLLATASGIALAAHFVTWFESLNWTSVAASVTLVQAQPMFVAVGAYFLLGERVTARTVSGIVLAMGGIVVMSFGGPILAALGVDVAPLGIPAGVSMGEASMYGNLLAVLGAIMAAGYVLAGRSLRQRISLLPYVTVVYGVCTVTLLVVALAEGRTVALTAYPRTEWLLFLGMAVGPGVLGHTVINWALKYVESSVVSVSLLGEPVGSTLLALLLLAEVPGPLTLAGGAVVLGGIYLTTTAD